MTYGVSFVEITAMERATQFRLTLRLLEYTPSRSERYHFRVHLETVEQFAALPYALVVEHKASGNMHTFHIRGITLSDTFGAHVGNAAYVEDISIKRDGEVRIIVTRASQMQAVPLVLEHGNVRLAEEGTGGFVEVRLLAE
jgi:hypothetical protein